VIAASIALAPSPASQSAIIGRAAVRALYTELALFPKPGLVSPLDSGAHHDMDMTILLRSLFALRGYFCAVAAAGEAGADFATLQALGIAAERRMLRATRGINTHRGAIFSLGLLAAAAGTLRAGGASIAGHALGRCIAERWGPAIFAAGVQPGYSHGREAVCRYGVRGARDEAAAGFPLLFDLALPTLVQSLSYCNAEAALVQTLFAIMAELDDTNLLHRGGSEGLAFVREEARAFLVAGGVQADGWRERALALHLACVAHRLSPGGAADMLAAAAFVHDLRTGPGNAWA
jgi:triphosphoribosyl-dephospho-CoA synthase